MTATFDIADITAALRAADIDYTVEHKGTLNATVVVGELHLGPAVDETGHAVEGIDSCDSSDQHDWHETIADAVARAARHAAR